MPARPSKTLFDDAIEHRDLEMTIAFVYIRPLMTTTRHTSMSMSAIMHCCMMCMRMPDEEWRG
jgi:hypothetical protein